MSFFHRLPGIGFISLMLLAASALAETPGQSLIQWQPHNAASFQQARDEKRFLILDLHAVWCHWCHVMEATTYQDPDVASLLAKHYVPLKADHDQRPDLAERYRDWGWPATIIFAPDGTELVKRSGYINPQEMQGLLQQIVDDPTPRGAQSGYPEQIADNPQLDEALRQQLQRRHVERFDYQRGGLDIQQKFIEKDSVLWDMRLARGGNKQAENRARLTLDGGLKLIDPEFGGAYQYSTHGDWQHPHYEKIMRIQARFIQVYSRAYQQFKTPEYLKAAEQVASYLNEFLSAPGGAFYNSQDADLKQGTKAHDYYALTREQRLKQGMPRIDRSLYASASGAASEALLELYRVTDNAAYLKRAEQALRWVYAERRLGRGGFRHLKLDTAGPYLADSLNVGRALLRYAQVEDDAEAIAQAGQTADFINRYFRHPRAGLVSAADNGTPLKPLPQIDQNISAAGFLLELYQLTGEKRYLGLAEHVLRYLNSRSVALSRITEAGLLRLDEEYRKVSERLQF